MLLCNTSTTPILSWVPKILAFGLCDYRMRLCFGYFLRVVTGRLSWWTGADVAQP